MSKGYKCECGKTIGLMADKDGRPERFRCPHTKRLQRPQVVEQQAPLKRKKRPVGDE